MRHWVEQSLLYMYSRLAQRRPHSDSDNEMPDFQESDMRFRCAHWENSIWNRQEDAIWFLSAALKGVLSNILIGVGAMPAVSCRPLSRS